jgi:exoribonuclease-2
LWASANARDSSRDLDQLTVAEATSEGEARILVAIADVDALVKKGRPSTSMPPGTTSVYTAAQIFPMLPRSFPPV